MRFRATISDILIFTRALPIYRVYTNQLGLVSSLERLGKRAWLRLTPSSVHFIILPVSQGTQVWSSVSRLFNSRTDLFRNLKTEVLFENDYICVSNMENQINLEIPLDTLHRALKSCSTSSETTIRLTKKDNNAYLALSTSIIVTQQRVQC
jgi:HUS1 checkpoint protein